MKHHPTTAQPAVPVSLKKTQEWFASILTQPFDSEHRIQPLTPRGVPIQEEAKQFVASSPKLEPWKRMELYNQQYWWRLLKIMSDMFPLVSRQFGYDDFNHTLSMPYLLAYPPRNWSLNTLGDRFVRWLQESYHQEDRKLVIESAQLDWAFYLAFFAAHHPSITSEALNPDALEELMDVKLYVQPHVMPFHWKFDLMQFRLDMLKEKIEHWEEHPFPEIKKGNCDIVLYRNPLNALVFEVIHEIEGLLLKRLIEGSTINQLCEWIERQPQKTNQAAEELLTSWIRHWVICGWLTRHPRD